MKHAWFIMVVLWLAAEPGWALDDHADLAPAATSVPSGTNGVAGLFEHDLDRDWFRFTAAPQLVYTIQVGNVSAYDNALSIKAFADGNLLVSTNSAFVPHPSRIVWTNQGGARTFYLGVSPLFDFTTGSYVVVVGANDADADGDGMADAWEILMFGTTTNGAAGDPDLDGISTLDEYRTGTHPDLPASGLRITNLVRSSGSATIGWPGVAFGDYRVEATANAWTGAWFKLTNRVQGATAGGMVHEDHGATNGFRNYRILYE